MADNSAFGVNQQKIMFVIGQIYKCCEGLSKYKLDFDEVIQEFHTKYTETFGNNFKSSLDDLSSKYDVVIKNVLSFVEDFNKLSSLANNMDSELQLNIKRDIAKFDSEYYIANYK